ncbi:hypothetical protein VNO80_05902 [Phaseolus coccineus]|uniref:Dehydrogenase E1 component domain-containing protein n=1 Tax=Phaseolus coccineus TaxID=3886 RepID=A0AAN9NH42_PHACN
MDKSRLVPLISMSEYEKALKDGLASGGVAAIIEERAYMEIFLETRSEFRVVGQEFSMSGWGSVKLNFTTYTKLVIQNIKPAFLPPNYSLQEPQDYDDYEDDGLEGGEIKPIKISSDRKPLDFTQKLSNSVVIMQYIQALTYRVEHHSKSDHSTKYRAIDEIEYWKMTRNPISRFKRWVKRNGWLILPQCWDLSSHKWLYIVGLNDRNHKFFSEDSPAKWESQNLPTNRMLTRYKTIFKAPMRSDPVCGGSERNGKRLCMDEW